MCCNFRLHFWTNVSNISKRFRGLFLKSGPLSLQKRPKNLLFRNVEICLKLRPITFCIVHTKLENVFALIYEWIFKKQTPKIRHFIQLFMKQVTYFEFTRSFAKEELTFKSSYFKLEISSLQIKRNPTVNYKPNDNTSGKKNNVQM